MNDPQAPFDFRRYLGLTDEELARLPRYDPQHPRLIRLLAALVWMKRRRILRESLIVVVGMAVAITAFVAVMAVIEPWNHSLFLWPTLTGTWFGDFVTPDGRKHLLLLQIDGDRENPPIGGTAATCDDRGVVREFSLSGWPRGWRGKEFRIDASGTGDTDGAGVGPGRLDGAYDGDTMRVAARLRALAEGRS